MAVLCVGEFLGGIATGQLIDKAGYGVTAGLLVACQAGTLGLALAGVRGDALWILLTAGVLLGMVDSGAATLTYAGLNRISQPGYEAPPRVEQQDANSEGLLTPHQA